ncbi:MAG: MBL fold metallo-hydrolase [Gemmataceae bacterium]
MSHPVQAASVILARQEGSRELFLVGRSPTLRFMGGMVAFPGGKLGEGDDELARPAIGLTPWHVAAIRELFEETGVLLVRQADGRPPGQSAELDRFRRLLLDNHITLAQMLDSAGWHLDPADLAPVGHLVTPPFSPLRFDTAFFTATLPPGQTATIWPGELSQGWWHSASEALTRWRLADLLLTPPTVSILQAIEDSSVGELPGRLAPLLSLLDRGRVPPIWFNPGVLMIPLDCQGLPPTTHTNTLLVGTGPTYLIDPGPVDAGEQAKLFESVDERPPQAIVLSHHHPDHVGAAQECARRYGVPILAHAHTADLLRGLVPVDRLLVDHEQLPLGPAPHGRGEWSLETLFTPGHAPGHLAFYQRDYGLLLAGDMVSTLSSMIISPEDGDLADYLASLERLKRYPTRLLIPAHGGPSTRATALLDETLAHRALREKQLLEALAQRSRSAEEIAIELYRGFPESVLRLARQQILTGLIKLQREGRVGQSETRWVRL